MRELLVFISILLSLSAYTQDKDHITPRDFSHVNDTISYDEVINEFLEIFKTKKGTVSPNDINKLIEIGEHLDYSKGLGKAHDLAARLYRINYEYQLAIRNYEKSIIYFKQVGFEKGVAIIQNQLYITEKKMGNLEKSAYYLLEAKNYFEKVHDSIALIAMYNNLGRVHLALKDYEFSEKEFLKSILLIKKSGKYLEELSKIESNLAEVYIAQKKYDEAEKIAVQTLITNKKDSVINIFAYSYITLGEVCEGRKEYKKAKKHYDSALYFHLKGQNRLSIIETKQRIGYIELLLGNVNEAKKMLTITRESFLEIDSKENLLHNYRLSSRLDSVQGDLKGALTWQHKYQKLSDEIAAELSTKKIEKKEEFYEAELAQLRTIDEQEIREQRNKEKLFRYRIFALITLGVLAISLLFVLWIIKTRKERKKLIVKLNDSNQVKNKLFSIISHDLKNEIHGLESSLNLMKDNEISTDEFDEIVPLLSDRTNQTSILLNNLLNWSKSQMKELRAKPIHFDVSEIISNKFLFFKPKANQKNIKLINKLGVTNIYADKDMVGIVAQNLIANAIKFCKSGNSITLLSKEKEDHYEIGFADTGVGIDPTNINKLFAEETFTTHGTQNESGTGLGLKICKELIELNHGGIRVESTLGEGSTFYISLPKNNLI